MSRRQPLATDENLKYPPLVEAILEVRWALIETSVGIREDPHYKFLLGRFYDKVSQDYPFHEQLPSAALPDEMAGQIVQHRFRTGKDDWPLVQLGPGILTLNSTKEYSWPDFRARCIAAVDRLFDAHPKPDELRVESIVLRYVDAVDVDTVVTDMFTFLKDNMGVETGLPKSLFADGNIATSPSQFTWRSSFRSRKPTGMVHVHFATGQKEGKPALVWETRVQSAGRDIPGMPSGFGNWVDVAHGITHDWFSKLIDGALRRKFSGE